MEEVHKLFKKYYMINDTDNLYMLLKDIDWLSLDYNSEINLIMLNYNIYITHSYYHPINPALIDLIKINSPISYNSLLQVITSFLHSQIIEDEPKNEYEKIKKFLTNQFINNKLLNKILTDDEKTQINLKLISELNTSNPNYEILCTIINNHNYGNKIFLDLDLISKTLNKFDLIKFMSHQYFSMNIKNMKIGLELLKQSKINQNLVSWYETFINIFEDPNLLIDPQILFEKLNLLYHPINDYIDKCINYKKITEITIFYLRINLTKNKHLPIYFQNIKNYCDRLFEESNFLDSDYKINLLLNNGILRCKYNYFGMVQNHVKLIEVIKEIHNYNDQTIGTILDLCVAYTKINQYEKAYEIFYKHKDMMLNDGNKLKNIFRIYNFELIINIHTNRIQTSCELSKLIQNERFNGDEYFYNKFNEVCKYLKNKETVIKNAGYKIVEDYDIESDVKGLKDSDNKLICPICLDNITTTKITLIECPHCSKYVGHFNCIYDYIMPKLEAKQKIKCTHCRCFIK